MSILGFGKMGQALAAGLAENKNFTVTAFVRNEGIASSDFEARFSEVRFSSSLKDSIQRADVIVLCVKPHQAQDLLKSARKHFKKNQILISICASVCTDDLMRWIQNRARVVRAMPNTPCLIRQGMTIVAQHKLMTSATSEAAQKIFSVLGRTLILDERLMDAATGLSGCGPAYVYLMIEALSDAGVKLGLPRKAATQMAAQTLLGASQMLLERDVHPAELKDEVSTPSGCTVDGLMALEEGALRSTLIRAVVAATERSKQLSKSLP